MLGDWDVLGVAERDRYWCAIFATEHGDDDGGGGGTRPKKPRWWHWLLWRWLGRRW
jgi:hypothetical protein